MIRASTVVAICVRCGARGGPMVLNGTVAGWACDPQCAAGQSWTATTTPLPGEGRTDPTSNEAGMFGFGVLFGGVLALFVRPSVVIGGGILYLAIAFGMMLRAIWKERSR